ncbi:MAG: hypothetical protein ACON4K_06280 [Akkermansiaceae bacterium]
MKSLYFVTAVLATSLSVEAFRLAQPANGQANEDIEVDLPESDPSGVDIVRFNNGDLIHGKFEGLDGGILWSRPDLEGKIKFKLKNLRQLVFDGARQGNPELLQAHVSLINGDQIPGEIVSLDADHLVLKSPIAGDLKIARKQIKSLTPNPFDGQLSYAGPFTSDGWVMLNRKVSDEARRQQEEEAAEVIKEGEREDQKEEAEKEAVKPKPSWLYSGASLYSANFNPVAFDAQLPDVGRIRFKTAWKNRLYLAVSFHADFTRPLPREIVGEDEPVEENAGDAEAVEGEAGEEAEENKAPEEKEFPPLKYESLFDQVQGKAFQSQEWLPESGTNQGPEVYGSSYTLTLNGSYPTLTRNTFDEEGNPKTKTFRAGRINSSFSNEGEAEFDIRFDRSKGIIYLYVDGQYASQWNDLDGYAGKGGSVAFSTLNANSRVRISDIFVTSWSGMQDNAKSMNHDDRDIALLTNGTDRFSGEAIGIANGVASFKSEFSEMSIPLEQLSEINFRAKGLADPEKIKWSGQVGTILFKPVGRVSLSPKSATGTLLKGVSPVLGEVTVDLSSAVLLNFADDSYGLSEWITDF